MYEVALAKRRMEERIAMEMVIRYTKNTSHIADIGA